MVIALIITALQTEAAPIIAHYGLKKDLSSHAFPIFTRDDVILCVAGTATHPAVAAAAVGYVFGRLGITKSDNAWLLHTGVCAADRVSGSTRAGALHGDAALDRGFKSAVLVPHTVVGSADTAAGHTFYPEMVYRHPFIEAMLTDAVAAAVLQGAAKFLPLHRIITAKGIASDQSAVILPWFTQVIAAVTEEIPRGMRCRMSKEISTGVTGGALDKPPDKKPYEVSPGGALFTKKERCAIDETVKRLRLTHSMRVSLEEACITYKVRIREAGIADTDTNNANETAYSTDDDGRLIALLSASGITPCTTKQEGKMALARLRQQLLSSLNE